MLIFQSIVAFAPVFVLLGFVFVMQAWEEWGYNWKSTLYGVGCYLGVLLFAVAAISFVASMR